MDKKKQRTKPYSLNTFVLKLGINFASWHRLGTERIIMDHNEWSKYNNNNNDPPCLVISEQKNNAIFSGELRRCRHTF